MKLYNEDCLIAMDRMIEDGIKVDAIITDPPYGTTACKWDSIIPLEPMWEQLKRVIKPNGAIVMTASQPFTTTLIASNMKMFKYCWVWDKKVGSNLFQAKKCPLKTHEDIAVFGRSINYIPQMTPKAKPQKQGRYKTTEDSSRVTNKTAKNKIAGKVYTHSYPKTIQTFAKEKRSQKQHHPTQKPVALMEYLIKTYTNEAETVLDFTMGSGTTGVACKNLNRKFIGIEIDETYFNIAEERIEKHTTQQKLFTGAIK
jgi:site-specific DNA-methyltransferase (adenine-specific)